MSFPSYHKCWVCYDELLLLCVCMCVCVLNSSCFRNSANFGEHSIRWSQHQAPKTSQISRQLSRQEEERWWVSSLVNNKVLKLRGRQAEMMHNSSGKLIKSPFLCPLQFLGTRKSHQPSHSPCTPSRALVVPESLAAEVGIRGRAEPGNGGPAPALGELFTGCCELGAAHAGGWCASEQRVGTISFLHAWLSHSVGTDRLRG